MFIVKKNRIFSMKNQNCRPQIIRQYNSNKENNNNIKNNKYFQIKNKQV